MLDLDVKLRLPIVIHEDNQGCIFITKNSETRQTKHIDTKWHFIRDCVNENKVTLQYIPTDLQEADLLTKPLQRKRFEYLRDLIGLKRYGVLKQT